MAGLGGKNPDQFFYEKAKIRLTNKTRGKNMTFKCPYNASVECNAFYVNEELQRQVEQKFKDGAKKVVIKMGGAAKICSATAELCARCKQR